MESKRFYTFCLYTIVCVALLFFLGGLVRATGSGMGCPDWPKCFGKIAPPTSEKYLPENYKEIFLTKRKKKIDKFIQLLNKIGLKEKAIAIQHNPDLLIAHPFNATTAYIEYVNRLFGVLTGIFMLAATYFSFSFRKTNVRIPVYTILALVMIVFNGWLGSIVVDTNLFSGLVSLHFIFAFAAIVFLLLAFNQNNNYQVPSIPYLQPLLIIGLIITTIQIFSGISMRALVEQTLGENASLTAFLDLGAGFAFHRYFSALVFMLFLFLSYSAFKKKDHSLLTKHLHILTLLSFLKIATGAMNITFSLPAASQVTHITLGALLFVFSFNALIIFNKQQTQIKND
jgi:cytochrome c oxidase assembly protein subunit 15